LLKDRLIDYDPATGRVNGPPQQIFLEVTGRCNLACVHCPKDYGSPAAAFETDLPLATVRRLQPWLERTRFVNLNMVGEPLVAPHFDEIVRLSCSGSAEVSFNTNATLFTERRCALFVERGVHSIAVSFDGLDSHERVRGVKYEAVRERLLLLARARDRAGSERPHIAIAYTLMRSNTRELPRLLADLLPRVRVHAVHVQPLVVFYETLRGENAYDEPAVDEVLAACRDLCARHGAAFTLFRSQFAQDERHRDARELRQELGPFSEVYGCTDPFFELKIRSTGEVVACSYGLTSGANVHDRDLDEIWNSGWQRELRKRLYAKVYAGACTHCPYVHGGAENQLDPLRPGVHHSRAERFLGRPPPATPARALPRGAPRRSESSSFPSA